MLPPLPWLQGDVTSNRALGETFDIRSDTGTPADDSAYQVPFKINGKIEKITISVEPPRLMLEDK